MSINERGIQEGYDVYTADDESLGTVREATAGYLHVHHGRLFGRDEYTFPAHLVGRVDGERAYLTLTKAEIEAGDWSEGGADEGRDVLVEAPAGATTAGRDTRALVGAVSDTTLADAEVLDQREIVLPIVEERLEITKEPVEVGAVLINRTIETEERTVPVEVAHEEVRVERRPVSREATADDLRQTGGEALALLSVDRPAIIPVIEEIVEVEKRLMVREELIVSKLRVTEEQTVTGTVRRTEPVVAPTGDLARADAAGAPVPAASRAAFDTAPAAPDLTPTRGAGAASAEEAPLDAGQELVVPVVEERLDITKRPVELGEVVITREVTSEERTVPVEVAHEEVRVERRAADRAATPDDLRRAAGEGLALLGFGESITIPLIEEVLDVRKRMFVREELVITKVRISERHDIVETLRRVEPHVEASGSLERDVEGTARTTAATTTTRVRDTDADAGRNPLQRAADAVGDAIDRVRDR